MGRFGNQAEQLLGSLYFAKSLNRTLVLPPFIHYETFQEPQLIPFDNIIEVQPLKEYHDVILIDDFMAQVAPELWTHGKRKFYCYTPRPDDDSCAPTKGQPFEKFWTSYQVSWHPSIFYKPLKITAAQADQWSLAYPIKEHPVLAFVGAPSSFPTDENSIKIQKFVHLSSKINSETMKFKREYDFLTKPYVSIHIRHGPDWMAACEHLKTNEISQLFSSRQCKEYNITGQSSESGILKYETCLPTFERLAQTLEQTIRYHRKSISIKIVHIATDYDDQELWQKFKSRFPQIKFVINPKASETMMGAMVDISLMTHADIFIGNCISSFSAFPARTRAEQLHLKLRTSYIGQSFDSEQSSIPKKNDEL